MARDSRNLTRVNTAKEFQDWLKRIDFSELTLIEIGCGEGILTRMLLNTNAREVITFEIYTEKIDSDIVDYSRNLFTGNPSLLINPSEYLCNGITSEGDFRDYDLTEILENKPFAIVGNPPYHLYPRIMGLTGEYLMDGDHKAHSERNRQFAGYLLYSSEKRIQGMPGARVLQVYEGQDFYPSVKGRHCLILRGFEGRIKKGVAIPDPLITVPRLPNLQPFAPRK